MKRARIIVLLIALASGGLAAKLAQMSDTPAPAPAAPEPAAQLDTVEVLVAGADLPLGQTLSVQNLSWQAWPAGAGGEFINKANRPNAIAELSGSRVRTLFSAGEPIREARLAKPGSGFMSVLLPKGMRAVASELSPENGAGGFILPGDHVDVILTRAQGAKGDETYVSNTILWNVRVLAIDHTIEEKNGQSTAVGKIATLELTSPQAETLALARRLGTISLVLRGLDDAATTGEDDAANLGKRESIRIVRYGVSTVIPR